MEPTGYSFSQKGTKFRLAARTIGSTSGTPKNTTSFRRDCSFRASAVIGFRCPATGILTKPNFILTLPAGRLDGPRYLAKATIYGLGTTSQCSAIRNTHGQVFIPGWAEGGLER